MQLFQKLTVSVQMYGTDLEGLSKTIGRNTKINLLLFNVEEGARRVLEVAAEKDDHLLWYNYYKVYRESLERKLSDQRDILKVVTLSVKHLESS